MQAAEEMRAGAEAAVITAGGRGAVAVSEEGAWWAWPPQTVVASAVGAGDALLAGLLLKLEEGASLEEWAAMAQKKKLADRAKQVDKARVEKQKKAEKLAKQRMAGMNRARSKRN